MDRLVCEEVDYPESISSSPIYSLPVFITPTKKSRVVLNDRFQSILLDSRKKVKENLGNCEKIAEDLPREERSRCKLKLLNKLKQNIDNDKSSEEIVETSRIDSEEIHNTDTLQKTASTNDIEQIILLSDVIKKQSLLNRLYNVQTKISKIEKVNIANNIEFVKVANKVHEQGLSIQKQNETIIKLQEMAKEQNIYWAQLGASSLSKNEYEMESYLKQEIFEVEGEIMCVRNECNKLKNKRKELVLKNNIINVINKDTVNLLKEHEERKKLKTILEGKVNDLRDKLKTEEDRFCELNFQKMFYKGTIDTLEEEMKPVIGKHNSKQVINHRRRNSSDTPITALRTPKNNLFLIKPVNASLSNSPVLRKKAH